MPGPPPKTDDDGTAIRNDQRYAVLGLPDDEVVIYDRENSRAWIQSDLAVATDVMA